MLLAAKSIYLDISFMLRINLSYLSTFVFLVKRYMLPYSSKFGVVLEVMVTGSGCDGRDSGGARNKLAPLI